MRSPSKNLVDQGPPTRVVICDCHPAFVKGLEVLLENYPDIDVVGTALTGKEAERLAKDMEADVAIIDIKMMEGVETARAIRQACPITKILVLTASDDPDDLREAFRAGATGYVGKTYGLDAIVETIRSVVRGQIVAPAGFAEVLLEYSDLHLGPVELTSEELKILTSIARGETNREIAAHTGLSERTIKRKIEKVYAKLNLSDRLEAAIYASKRGLE